ncbi:MAG: DUF6443 domain-containing protein, partial [Maribacter sp.]
MTNHRDSSFLKISLALVIFIAFSAFNYAQNLIGPTSVLPNSTETYTFNNGGFYIGASWSATGGTLVPNSQTQSGSSFTVAVDWGSSGTGSIAFLSNNTILETLNVTIQNESQVLVSDENYIHNITPRIATADISNLGITDKIEAISYFDGLGRPMQQVAIKGGGNSEDIITHIGYDEYGRQVKDYLPYSSTTGIGSYRSDALTATHSFYGAVKYDDDFPTLSALDINPYSEKQFDGSPLNRVMKQAAPGEDWKLGEDNEIEMDYQTNTATEVRRYEVTLSLANNTYTPTLVLNTAANNNNGYYEANELYKTITKDENHDGTSAKDHTTEEFKNKQGQVLLKR